mmetsp:Transcript_13615/g.23160  ORF Transcript_13615/g.23160 Transcript_13615/m.23160 type:complete len:757 (-) Transcript_13615:141-2411(-)|eukprot:CAMPEP_0184694840 /NCGR_PEP_ID=MMETSP0313-20130426/2677_1 /TAXON_ID=2792 /ORGANISM="Porphyridium aerugineum, Strain SAG 1380-2" /LENGTH=756 /DNA_ID=CAMNT_0027153199 /DNA_START=331 /DNA_END=2601 /DNA_ORIENTATION=+
MNHRIYNSSNNGNSREAHNNRQPISVPAVPNEVENGSLANFSFGVSRIGQIKLPPLSMSVAAFSTVSMASPKVAYSPSVKKISSWNDDQGNVTAEGEGTARGTGAGGAGSHKHGKHHHHHHHHPHNSIVDHVPRSQQASPLVDQLELSVQLQQRQFHTLLHNLESNPDAVLDWSVIEVVTIPLPLDEHKTCSICLNDVVAPKMTRCGHVFCHCCLIQMFGYQVNKCPLCSKRVEREEIKPVMLRHLEPVSLGSQINMSLLIRKKTSSLHIVKMEAALNELISRPLRTNKTVSASSSPSPSQRSFWGYQLDADTELDDADRNNFARLTYSDETQIMDLLQSDVDALMDMRNLTEKGELPSHLVDTVKLEITRAKDQRKELKSRLKDRRLGNPAIRTNHSALLSSRLTMVPEDMRKLLPANIKSDFVMWFQSADGQHLYLHPVNVKMLLHQYGCLQECPLDIHGRLVFTERYTMTPNLRKRFRFLSHLPLGCDFALCELDMSESNVLSPETLAVFAQEQAERQSKRERIQHHQNRREQKYDEKVSEIHNREHVSMYGDMYTHSLIEQQNRMHMSVEDAAEFPDLVRNPASLAIDSLESSASDLVVGTTSSGSKPSFSGDATWRKNDSSFGSYAKIASVAGGYFPALGTTHGSNDTPSAENARSLSNKEKGLDQASRSSSQNEKIHGLFPSSAPPSWATSSQRGAGDAQVENAWNTNRHNQSVLQHPEPIPAQNVSRSQRKQQRSDKKISILSTSGSRR